MIFSLEQPFLREYLTKIINSSFPDDQNFLLNETIFYASLDRLKTCFSNINKKYYRVSSVPSFNHLNSDHMCSLIYFISNESYLAGDITSAEKFFYLNKILHGLDLFYSIKLPETFIMVHPVGTVIGNASFGDFMVFYQNVTIGSDIDGIYPRFDGECILFSGSSVIGDVKVGKNVIIGARSFVLHQPIPADTVFTGVPGSSSQSPSKISVKNNFFLS